MDKDCPTLYFIAGVTASGKSDLALDWAEKNSAEILSCDSIAVYQGMNIGSAKPSIHDQSRVKHYGLDLENVDKRYDISKYLNYAQGVITEAYKRNSRILVVGGSGFYLRSFFSAVIDEVVVSKDIRKSVEALYLDEGLIGLLAKLDDLNSGCLGDLDQANPVRVIKSLERCLATGLTISELRTEFEKKPVPYIEFKKRTCLLDRSDEDLEVLIKNRTETMLMNGLIEETEKLLPEGLQKNYPASSSVGYRETISYLRGKITKSELGSSIRVSTRQLVSKQRKWFRKYYTTERLLVPSLNRAPRAEDLDWNSET